MVASKGGCDGGGKRMATPLLGPRRLISIARIIHAHPREFVSMITAAHRDANHAQRRVSWSDEDRAMLGEFSRALGGVTARTEPPRQASTVGTSPLSMRTTNDVVREKADASR